jgi:iron complex outermembrane receptor protein
MFNYDLRAERNDQDGSMTRALSKADAFKDPYLVNVDQRGATFRSFLTQAISVSHFAKKFTIKSITAYQDIRLRYENYDLDNSPLDFQSYSTPTTQPSNALTQEIRLSSAADESKRLRWTAGLFYFQSKDLDNIAYRNGKDSPPLDLGNGVKLPAPYTNVTYSTSKASGYATYGQLNYKLGNKTDLQLGLRYDNEISRLITRSELEYPGQPTQTTLPTTEVETSFGALTPKISLLQTLDERSSIYATYTRGYRPGGVNPYTNDPLYLTFAPEFSNNFELGYKIASLNQRLRWSVAAFQVNLRDQQLYTITSGFNFATLNIGDIVSRGLESELSLIIAKGLQFDWNLGLTNASYLELPYFRFGPEGTPETVDFSENRPIQSPVTTSFFAVQYSLPLGKQTIFSLRGEWKYTGKQYFDYANTIDQPAFSVFNTRMALNYKQMELAFWIRNLGDQRYLTYAYPFLLTAAQMANPRTLGLSVGTRF